MPIQLSRGEQSFSLESCVMTETSDIPEGKRQERQLASQFDLGGLTKLVSVSGAFAYAVGVVAINTYLHELGIVDFSFAKPKLLLTGIVVLFTFALLALPPFFVAWSMASRHGLVGQTQASIRGMYVSTILFLLILILASGFLCFSKNAPGMGQIAVWKVWELVKPKGSTVWLSVAALLIALQVYLPILFGSGCVYAATRLFDKIKSEEPASGISVQQYYLAVVVGAIAISCIAYVSTFTRTFYPAIPQEFGGGQPYYESFAIADQDRCQLEEMGIVFFPGTDITKPLPVLHETDTTTAVWLDSPSASTYFVVAEFNKQQISDTMVHVPKPQPLPKPQPNPQTLAESQPQEPVVKPARGDWSPGPCKDDSKPQTLPVAR
jgi:hypothetical protein